MTNKKWTYGLIAASLAANLFFAGMLTVFLIKGEPERPPRGPDQFNMMAARDLLSEDSQALVDGIWQNFRKEQRGEFKTAFMARKQLQDILLADDFDDAAFRRAFNDMEETGLRTRFNIEEVLGEIARNLPADERKLYFERLMQPRPNPRQKRGEKGEPGGR